MVLRRRGDLEPPLQLEPGEALSLFASLASRPATASACSAGPTRLAGEAGGDAFRQRLGDSGPRLVRPHPDRPRPARRDLPLLGSLGCRAGVALLLPMETESSARPAHTPCLVSCRTWTAANHLRPGRHHLPTTFCQTERGAAEEAVRAASHPLRAARTGPSTPSTRRSRDQGRWSALEVAAPILFVSDSAAGRVTAEVGEKDCRRIVGMRSAQAAYLRRRQSQ